MKTMIVIIAVSLAPYLRESNSHAAAARGAKAYATSKYAAAVDAYSQAQKLKPSARGAFNLGTSQIAAGNRELGSATLSEALKDPALRADALFNRGNSALAAKAFEQAAADYKEALKLRPNDAAAKRNLEIALVRQRQQQRSGESGKENKNQNAENDRRQQQQSQAPQPKPGDIDLDALLRSVQQQEQEELRRMKARAGEAKVGW
jgi:Ca-activated chloride channel homolog